MLLYNSALGPTTCKQRIHLESGNPLQDIIVSWNIGGCGDAEETSRKVDQSVLLPRHVCHLLL